MTLPNQEPNKGDAVLGKMAYRIGHEDAIKGDLFNPKMFVDTQLMALYRQGYDNGFLARTTPPVLKP